MSNPASIVFLLVFVLAALAPVDASQATGRALWRVDKVLRAATHLTRAQTHQVYAAHMALQQRSQWTLQRQLCTLNVREVAEVLATSLGAALETTPACSVDSRTASAPNCSCLNILDSGTGVHCLNSMRYVIKETERSKQVSIATANGVIKPTTMRDARIRVITTTAGAKNHLYLHAALILPHSQHNFISVGKLVAEQRVTMCVTPSDMPGYLTFQNSSHLSLANVGLPYSAMVCAARDDMVSAVHGAKGRPIQSQQTTAASGEAILSTAPRSVDVV